MKIIKIVCHQRYAENAISNLAAVLSAIHKGERVTMAEVRNAALNAVAELESRVGSKNAAVRALIQAEEFDQVKVNFMVSDLEGDAVNIYWNINDLPAGAKTDRVFWGDLLQRTDVVWQQIKELQKVVKSREESVDSRNRHKAAEAVEKMVKEAKSLADQAAKALFEAAPSTQEIARLQQQMDDVMEQLETFQADILPMVNIPGDGQLWVCLSNRAYMAFREASRMSEAIKEKSKIADKVELKIAKLEQACKEQISNVKVLMEAGPAIGPKSKDILYAISEVNDHASEIHDTLVEKREAAIGPVKEYWDSCVKRVSKVWSEMTGTRDELLLILDNQQKKQMAVEELYQKGVHLLGLSEGAFQNAAPVDTDASVQAQKAQANQFAMQMSKICKENNQFAELVAKAMNDEKNPASAKRQLLAEVTDFYKQCVMASNKLNGYLRGCSGSEYDTIQEMIRYIDGIRRNCVTMAGDLRKALAADKGMEKLLSAIFDGTEDKPKAKLKAKQPKVEPVFNADAEIQTLLGCADKAELLKKLKALQEKLGA